MQTRESFFFLEPVKYIIRTRLGPHYRTVGRERIIVRRATDERYFFDRVIRKNERDFEAIDVMAEFSHAIKERMEHLSSKLRGKLETIMTLPEMIEKLSPPDFLQELTHRVFIDVPLRVYYFYKHNSSIILPVSPNVFYILSRSREEAAQLMQFIKSEFEKLNEVTKDFGLELVEFLTGRSYQESLLRASTRIQNTNYKEPKDEFEKEIIGVCERTTSSFLSNVEIAFTEPTETFEYDIFIGFTEDVKAIIEPTNYETIKDQIHTGEIGRETLKSKVILGTQDKAQRLGAKSIVIAKGFPEDTFNELKKIADSRGVRLLSELNYNNELAKIFLTGVLEAYSQPRRYFVT